MVEVPEKFSDPLFRRLFILSEIGNFTPDELKQYEESMKDMSDYYNIIETAAEEAEKRGHARGREEGREEGREKGREEGREEGRAEGRAQGRAEGRAEMISRMYAKGMSTLQISELIDMDIAEIETLRESY